VDAGRVGDRAHVFALGASHAGRKIELGDGLWRVSDEPLLERRIHPGTGYNLSAVERSHLGLEEIEDRIDGLVRDDALLDQKSLQGAHARRAMGLAIFAVFETVIHDDTPEIGGQAALAVTALAAAST
jgi:hypothetical protein